MKNYDRGGVSVIIHNTLDASDYGLLDEKTLTPRPNYWAALLWHKLMGTTVFESGVPIREGLHLCVHNLRGHSGSVALLAINNSRTQSTKIILDQMQIGHQRQGATAPVGGQRRFGLTVRPISADFPGSAPLES